MKKKENQSIKKQKVEKNKKTSIHTQKNITNKIPYINCYEEMGLFKIEQNKYSITYKIEEPKIKAENKYNIEVIYKEMEDILSSIAIEGFSFRFTIMNSNIPEQEYINSIMLKKNKSPEINHIIDDYNEVLKDNVNIGHNNFKMSIYLTLILEEEYPEEAIKKFKIVDEIIKEKFLCLYGYIASLTSLEERLHILYNMYHLENDALPFGEKVNFDGNGFSIASMNRMKLNTKDVIAPSAYECKERNYIKINDKYGRMFFINMLPRNINDSILTDLISISCNSMISITYQPINSDYGFKTSARLVKENSEIKRIMKKDTVEDRKYKRYEETEKMKVENEEHYFEKAALSVFKDGASEKKSIMLTTFVIGLFADTLEELERDTQLLKISADKYSCKIKCCDYLQNESFQALLPLGTLDIDYARTFSLSTLSKILPVDIHSLFDNTVTFQGLNNINDNFILLDRKNYSLGLIIGTKKSGKTVSLKRDIANTLMSTDDLVIVMCPDKSIKEYEKFVSSVNGTIHSSIKTDLYSTDENYGLTSSRNEFKKMFLEAFISSKIEYYKKNLSDEELEIVISEIEKEAKALCSYEDYLEAYSFAKEYSSDFKMYLKAIQDYIPTKEYPDYEEDGRLSLITYSTISDLLIQLDYLWNYAIYMKKSNKNIWLYIEGIDDFCMCPMLSDYFIGLLDKFEKLRIPLTATINDCTRICSNEIASIEFYYILQKFNFYKLHNQGIIERKKIVDKLNIPQSLVSYITDSDVGTGLIITPSANISFNDRFDKNNAFYQRFLD